MKGGTWLDVEELDAALHDARLELSGVTRQGKSFIVPGSVVRLGKRRLFPVLVRHRIELRFEDVESFTFEDDERIQIVVVRNVIYDDDREMLVLNGAIPGRVVVQTAARSQS